MTSCHVAALANQVEKHLTGQDRNREDTTQNSLSVCS